MKRIKLTGTKKNGQRFCLIIRNETVDDKLAIARQAKKLTNVSIVDFD